tara:strand:+ start:8520 stop:10604 length:2085 start_codon:yes stop_codon:yes gene_type:complete
LYQKGETRPDGGCATGKEPKGAAWQERPRSAEQWTKGTGIGVICGRIPEGFAAAGLNVHCLDVDARHEPLAEQFEAWLSEYLKAHPGAKLKRTGKPPKFLVPFTCPEELRKSEYTSRKFYSPGVSPSNRYASQLEVLGAGNQFVSYAVHPETDKPYQWEALGRPGAFGELHATTPRELVTLSADDLATIKAAFIRLAGECGLVMDPQANTSQSMARADENSFLKVGSEALRDLNHDCLPGKVRANWPEPVRSLNAEFEVYLPKPASPENIMGVWEQLHSVSADCDYEDWRSVIWSILSTGWECAEDIAREWSETAAHRYNPQAFAKVVHSFDPDRGITLGTLEYHARRGGWQPDTQMAKHNESEIVPGRLLTVGDLRSLPRIQWIVRGILPTRGLAAVYGPPSSGKTFLALDLACSIACGLSQWFGARLKATPVVYIALEGEAGIRQRLEAWQKENQPLTTQPLRVVLGNFNLSNLVDIGALSMEIIDTVGKHAVVFIDTLNQSSPGADENSSSDMGRLISNAKFLANEIEGVTVLVHHSGKDSGRGMRGHSSLLAAMDAVIEVVQKQSLRTWRIVKSKDGETGAERIFDLCSHLVGEDEDEQPIFSCAVKPSLLVPKPGQKKVTGKNQEPAMKVLTQLAEEHHGVIPTSHALKAVGEILTCDPRRKTHRAKAIISNLEAKGHISITGEEVRLD